MRIGFIALLLVAFAVVGCSNSTPPTPPVQPEPAAAALPAMIVDYEPAEPETPALPEPVAPQRVWGDGLVRYGDLRYVWSGATYGERGEIVEPGIWDRIE